ncbi:MAG: hypothetical protein INF41_05045 [Rhodospirillaceae bacterium]|jgi:hypothetical protein|nr:hypothetical protein [Rhodospirillaceae bacterium]
MLFPSSTIPSYRKNRQNGFALALVLVVVALIGMIVASISLDTSSTQATATANEDRLAAGTLTRIGSAAGDALNNMIYSKGNRVETIFADRVNNQTAAQNLLSSTGTWKIPQTNINAYATDGGGTCTQNNFQTAESLPATSSCFLYFTRVATSLGSRGTTPTNSSYIVYSGLLTTTVGLQVNNLLWQGDLTLTDVPTTAGVPAPDGDTGLGKIGVPATLGNPTVIAKLDGTAKATSTAVPLAGTTATPGLPVINGAARPEGVYDSNGATANTLTNGNIYYKVLLAL